MKKHPILWTATVLVLLLAGCGSGAGEAGSAPAADGKEWKVFEPATWLDHMEKDLVPFWTSPEALGQPVGNFPTVRGFDGRVLPSLSHRLPRMMGRQIYFYSIAYMMTGKPELLSHAAAGVRWLIDKGWDRDHGGWHQRLLEDGSPVAGPKYAQDMAYAAQGLAAYYLVTRDPEAEDYLKRTHDLMFDPATFWDPANGRIKDGMDPELKKELDQEGGGWELVALLDQINAYMLMVQPILTLEADRQTWARDLETLGRTLVREFWKDGIFWGQKDLVGMGGRHVDFGHTFKSYWMAYLMDARLGTDIASTIPGGMEGPLEGLMNLSWDPKQGLWAMAPRNDKEVYRGSSWWIYAESDQIAMTWNLRAAKQGTLDKVLSGTLAGWLEYFVDRQWGEVIPEIQANGKRAGRWPAESTDKVHDWKNGFHSAEHALIAYIHAFARRGESVPLWFAPSDPEGFEADAYVFPARETGRSTAGAIKVAGRNLIPLRLELKVELD